jgi:phosphatidate cytidylyltransferase
MKLRIITAFVLLGFVVCAVLFFTQPMFLVVSVALLMLMLNELLTMLDLRVDLLAWLLVVVVCLLLSMVYIIAGPMWIFVFVAMIWLGLFGLLIYYRRRPFVSSRFNYLACALGTIICLVFALSLYGLRDVMGSYALLALIVFVCVIDSMAYFVGRTLGRIPLLSKVSPGKTIEGAIGGVVSGVLFAWCMASPHFFNIQNHWKWLPVVALLAVISVLGDLVQSMLKRMLLLKDSGAMLPGHGGLLDRVDSHLAVLPWFVLGYWYILGEVRWLS